MQCDQLESAADDEHHRGGKSRDREEVQRLKYLDVSCLVDIRLRITAATTAMANTDGTAKCELCRKVQTNIPNYLLTI